MAFMNNPQHVALENLQHLLLANQQQQNVLLLAVVALRRRRRRERDQAARPRNPRRWWVKPWVRQRQVHSQFENLFQELDEECDMDYMSYVRMDRNTFAEILQRVAPRLRKNPR